MKILVIVAHQDDEVLGCGATIAKLIEQGNECRIVFMNRGFEDRQTEEQAFEAGAILGLNKSGISFHEFVGSVMDTYPLLEVIQAIEGDIREFKPGIIFTHSIADLNIDHSITAKAVLTATRPLSESFVGTIYAIEIPSSTEWGFGQIAPVFSPNTFQEVSADHVSKKLNALAIYGTEARRSPHPRSPEALTAKAKVWGSVAGVEFAEAFQLIRQVKN